MLSEIRNVRQIEGEGTRRWFTDRSFDLIVWYDDSGNLSGFQLCYDKRGPPERVAERFLRESGSIDPELARLVYDSIRGQPSLVGQTSQALRGEAAYEHSRD